MISTFGKRWQVWSRIDPNFDIRGYTKGGEDCEKDAISATKLLAKVMGKSIPTDIEFVVTSTDQ